MSSDDERTFPSEAESSGLEEVAAGCLPEAMRALLPAHALKLSQYLDISRTIIISSNYLPARPKHKARWTR
jgi:hypothetical protein